MFVVSIIGRIKKNFNGRKILARTFKGKRLDFNIKGFQA
ncbi:hypothetical protein ELI_4532 [Eubacterium callanderi]|uniref:Uncharacterized protein n=1 Tax=Eubacterium callanderi TaxID=53442 RepID=E3GR24_9FIRM|nr:hypothetical protein ELI_4532 [Eubacterium callanderi]